MCAKDLDAAAIQRKKLALFRLLQNREREEDEWVEEEDETERRKRERGQRDELEETRMRR